MFLFQEIKNIQNKTAGQEIARWILENQIVFLLVGVLLSVGFVWILTKVAKQIRTFGK
ncbi:hypothetical protein [Tenacibaculum finnmarkense]|uniref:Uncharacterized protein n=1 Tax=Tenacibaculum finnmarkense genomovar finnmarkense TaxID=1458503 RepID=A0AAP1RCH4_9FLAO|nr:hypothetical protein [Tenacibaculum finnmarkense]MBE7651824.1 hypothetical protein [Tenacibaculum finnmarkense genomovar finnmarkense]MBE7693826.1 hypothetical protein [Tenacibaculum finnmarkense genomovar finnmarkense]MCD8428143.1 hypothetical protein [Tenacibaculum finnmarkense genomovar finnmarkense]MCG8731873.1 hypothetical protein [Tenacibaculum finnmarkense]MCG8752386.1 hypothetical protein [Tenacibaculum finnmarkense]